MDKGKIEYMVCDKKHVSLSDDDAQDCSTVCQYCEENTDFSAGNVCLFIMDDCEVYFCDEECLSQSWGQWYDLEKVDCLPEYRDQYADLERKEQA